MAASIIAAYFILAPSTSAIPGFGLASAGLAIKMVAVQLLGVIIAGVIIARSLAMRFDWYHQVSAILIGVLSGWGSREFVLAAFSSHAHLAMMFAIAAVLHFGLIAMILFLQPWLVASTRK